MVCISMTPSYFVTSFVTSLDEFSVVAAVDAERGDVSDNPAAAVDGLSYSPG